MKKFIFALVVTSVIGSISHSMDRSGLCSRPTHQQLKGIANSKEETFKRVIDACRKQAIQLDRISSSNYSMEALLEANRIRMSVLLLLQLRNARTAGEIEKADSSQETYQ